MTRRRGALGTMVFVAELAERQAARDVHAVRDQRQQIDTQLAALRSHVAQPMPDSGSVAAVLAAAARMQLLQEQLSEKLSERDELAKEQELARLAWQRCRSTLEGRRRLEHERDSEQRQRQERREQQEADQRALLRPATGNAHQRRRRPSGARR